MLKTLISIRMKSVIGTLIGRKGKASRGGMIVLLAVLVICFAFLSLSVSSSVGVALLPMGFSWAYFAIIQLLSFGMVFFFSIFETKTDLFECNDNELLISMPIKPIHILLSRIFAILVINLCQTLIIVIPAAVVYFVYCGDLIGVFGCIITALFLCCLSTTLAGVVGYLVASISSKLKNKSFITLALSVLFLALYFIGYSALMSGMDFLVEDPESAAIVIKDSLGIIKPIGDASLLVLPSLLAVAAVCLAVCVSAYLLMSVFYLRIITGSRSASSRVYKGERLSSGSAFSALAKKELRRFTSSAGYMLNGTVGVIFQVMLCGALLTKQAEIGEIGINLALMLGSDENVIFLAVLALLSFIPMVNTISAAALSLEGSCIDILRSLPVEPSAILAAKMVPHLVVCAPLSLVSSVIAGIALDAPLIFLPFYIVTPLLFCFISAALGLILNVLMPKFDFENEMQVIKQSIPVTIMVLSGMFGSIILVGGVIALALLTPSLVAAVILTLVALLVSFVLLLLLRGPILRRLSSILNGKN